MSEFFAWHYTHGDNFFFKWKLDGRNTLRFLKILHDILLFCYFLLIICTGNLTAMNSWYQLCQIVNGCGASVTELSSVIRRISGKNIPRIFCNKWLLYHQFCHRHVTIYWHVIYAVLMDWRFSWYYHVMLLNWGLFSYPRVPWDFVWPIYLPAWTYFHIVGLMILDSWKGSFLIQNFQFDETDR